MNPKMKAIMSIIDSMDEDMLGKLSLGDKMEEKPDVKITKVAVIPKEKMEEEGEEDETEKEEEGLSSLIPEKEDENEAIVKLKKKFSKV